jgi:hypothetical protein
MIGCFRSSDRNTGKLASHNSENSRRMIVGFWCIVRPRLSCNLFWFIHLSSLAVTSRGIWLRSGIKLARNGLEFFLQVSFRTLQGSLTCHKILRYGANGFTFPPKGDELRIFMAHKNLFPRPGLNPRTLGPMASTLTTRPPRTTNICMV